MGSPVQTAAAKELPEAVAVMDLFHVVQLAIHGHRGRRNEPLYRSRRTLMTGADLLTDRQRERLVDLFTGDAYVEVEAGGRTPPATIFRSAAKEIGSSFVSVGVLTE